MAGPRGRQLRCVWMRKVWLNRPGAAVEGRAGETQLPPAWGGRLGGEPPARSGAGGGGLSGPALPPAGLPLPGRGADAVLPVPDREGQVQEADPRAGGEERRDADRDGAAGGLHRQPGEQAAAPVAGQRQPGPGGRGGRVGGAERGWAGPKPGAPHAGGGWPASPPPTWPLFRHAQAEVHPFRPHPEEKSVPLSLTRVSGVRSRNLILWLEMQEETLARPLASWATADEHPVASAPSHVTTAGHWPPFRVTSGRSQGLRHPTPTEVIRAREESAFLGRGAARSTRHSRPGPRGGTEHRHEAAGAGAARVCVLSRMRTVPSAFSAWAHLTRRTRPPGGPPSPRKEPGYKRLSSLSGDTPSRWPGETSTGAPSPSQTRVQPWRQSPEQGRVVVTR